MKKPMMMMIVFLLAVLTTGAQTYKITFSGSGMSTAVSSVKVWNLTHDTSLTMSGTDTLLLVKPIGISNPDKQTLLTEVFPNPSSGTGTAMFFNREPGTVVAEVFDLQGKTMLSATYSLPEGEHSFSFGGLPQGTFLIRFSSNNQTAATKWVSLGAGGDSPHLNLLQTTGLSSSGAKLSGQKGSIQIPYIPGDILMFKGTSGNYARIVTLVATQNQTVDFDFISCTDGSNNHYPVVSIGTQTWMASNLRTSKYNNGTAIPRITDNNSWSNTTTPAFCWYDNDSATHAVAYGALYKWYTVDVGNLCPTGWHVPSVAEWNTLAQFLGGDTLAGGKMKETGTLHWDSLFAGTTNSSGFTALPAGIRQVANGTFSGLGLQSYYWTATDYSSSFAHIRQLTHNSNKLNAVGNNKGNGFSVRCIKD